MREAMLLSGLNTDTVQITEETCMCLRVSVRVEPAGKYLVRRPFVGKKNEFAAVRLAVDL